MISYVKISGVLYIVWLKIRIWEDYDQLCKFFIEMYISGVLFNKLWLMIKKNKTLISLFFVNSGKEASIAKIFFLEL